MSLTNREFWTLIHGMILGATFLLSFTGGLVGLYALRPQWVTTSGIKELLSQLRWGIFNIKLEPYKADNQVNTTLAQQLALYVVIYSPIQMAADLQEFYEGQPALQFISDVGVDWKQSKVLNGG